jgi:tripartite-type tricarboxylate transporter receptor subunit TctC
MEMLKDAAGSTCSTFPTRATRRPTSRFSPGDVQAVFGSMPGAAAEHEGEQAPPLAVGTAARSPALPEVPTVAEQGYPGFEAALWLGIMGPPTCPRPSSIACTRRSLPIVATPEFKAAMDANGAEPLASKSPDEFRAMLREQVGKYVKITKAIGIKLD